MIKFRKGIQQIMIYSFGLLSTKLVALFMLPIITHYLNPAQYGNLEVLQLAGYLVSIICGFGINDAIFRYAGSTKVVKLQKQFCNNGATLNLILSAIIFIICIVFTNPIRSILPGHITEWQIYFISTAMFFNNLWVYQLSCMRIRGEAFTYVLVSVLFTLVFAFSVLIVLHQGYRVTGIMFASLLAQVATYLFVLTKSPNTFEFKPVLQSRLFYYGLPLILSGIGEFIILWMGNFWLAYQLPMAEFAQFALAMKFSIIISYIIAPIITWWYPIRFKNLELPEGRIHCANISDSVLSSGFLLTFMIAIASSVFIRLFISSAYLEAIHYLPWTCLIFSFKIAGDIMNTGVLYKHTRYVMVINTIAAFLCILGLYFLVPLYEIWGAIITLNAVYLTRWLAFIFFGQTQIVLPYKFKDLGFLLVVLILCLLMIHHMQTTANLIIYGGIISLLIIFLLYIRGLIPKFHINN